MKFESNFFKRIITSEREKLVDIATDELIDARKAEEISLQDSKCEGEFRKELKKINESIMELAKEGQAELKLQYRISKEYTHSKEIESILLNDFPIVKAIGDAALTANYKVSYNADFDSNKDEVILFLTISWDLEDTEEVDNDRPCILI